MGTGYTRNDTSNNIADGNIINAADLDGEFDAIESAMGTSGHTHDGTSAEGGPVTVLGPVQDFVASATEIKPKTTNTLDIGTSGLLFKDMFLDGVATVGSIKIDNAGTIGSASDSDAIAISSGGVVSFSQNTIGKTASGHVLSLQTSDTTVEATNVLGKIEFSAPDEASGTDAILVGASIEALAEATFDSSTNSTALVFKTNTTGAATERMRLTSAGDLHFLDNRKAIFGAGSDLQIYHSGSGNSVISEAGSGNLLILADELQVLNAANTEVKATFNTDGAVNLHYDGSEKLATTSTGVDITGTLTSDGLTVDGAFEIFGTSDAFGSTASSAYILKTGSLGTAPFTQTGSLLYQPRTSTVDGRSNHLFYTGDPLALRMNIQPSGDISFYEDTGTTAKFFWDASAEALGIGTTTPATSAAGTVLKLERTGSTRLNISAANVSYSAIDFGDTDDVDVGRIEYYHANNAMFFHTNAAERMRIDSSGSLLHGTTSSSIYNDTSGNGVNIKGQQGQIIVAKESTSASDPAMILNDTGVDSSIIQFSKDGSSVGSIGVNSGYMYLGSGDTGLYFNSVTNQVYPVSATGGGSNEDGTQDLGRTTARFKDLYLSGGLRGDTTFKNNAGTTEYARFDSSGNLLVSKTSQADGATAGHEFLSDGRFYHTKSGDHVGRLNRLSTDGDILRFAKDGTPVGSIGSASGATTYIDGGSQFAGLQFGGDGSTEGRITPRRNGASADAATNLGTSSLRFKELHLSVATNYGESGTDQFVVGKSASENRIWDRNGQPITFLTSDLERMRIDSSGNLLVGATSETTWETAAGFRTRQSGSTTITRSAAPVLYANRLTSDGDIVEFRKDGAPVGSIGVQGGDAYYAGTSKGIKAVSGFIGATNTTGVLQDNNTDLGSSSYRFKDLYLSGGVYLGGTGSANKLDDYEEGTWTPTITGSATNPASTANAANKGFYTKVGRQVTVCFRVDYSSVSGGSGNFEISGLPFTTNSNSYFRSSGNIGFFRGVTHGGNRLAPHAITNDTKFIFYKLANTSEFDDVILVGALASSVTIHGFYIYFTD